MNSFNLKKFVGGVFIALISVVVIFNVFVFIFFGGVYGIESTNDAAVETKVKEYLLSHYNLRGVDLELTSKEKYTTCFGQFSADEGDCSVPRTALNVYDFVFSGYDPKRKKNFEVTYRNARIHYLSRETADVNLTYVDDSKKK